MPLRRLHRAEPGQSTVEFALALPAMMIAAVLAYNALAFFGNCAVFDRAVRDAVRVYASSEPAMVTSSAQAQVLGAVRGQVDGSCEVAVVAGATSRGFTQYTATLTYTPSLFGRPLRGDVFGVSLGRPVHRCTFVIDTLVTG